MTLEADDAVLAATRAEARRRAGGAPLTGASPPRPRGSRSDLARSFPRARSDPLAPAAARPPDPRRPNPPSPRAPDADAEERWLATLVRDLRRLVPRDGPSDPSPSGPGPPRATPNLGTAFVRAASRARPASVASDRDPPFPALPLGSRLVSIAELETLRACRSDLETLWSRSRSTRSHAEEEDEDAATRAAPLNRARQTRPPEPKPEPPRLPPLAPLALVGRLQLAPARSLADPAGDDPRSEVSGLFLVDATGAAPTHVAGALPDARLLDRVVLAEAWTLPTRGFLSSEGQPSDAPPRAIEVRSFVPLEPEDFEGESPAMAPAPDATAPARAPPKPSARVALAGAVVAVSPLITYPGDEARDEPASRFFMVELGPCPRCGRGVDAEGPKADRLGGRLVFDGETSARWRPFFGAAAGGEFTAFERDRDHDDDDDGALGDGERRGTTKVCGGCVRVTNLRKTRVAADFFEREPPSDAAASTEIRLAAATAATTVTPRERGSSGSPPGSSSPGPPSCACAACAAGKTLSRLEAFVARAPDETGAGVVLVASPAAVAGVPLLMTHAATPAPARGAVFPALRAGASVVITHAHPVWRRDESDAAGTATADFFGDPPSDDPRLASLGHLAPLAAVGACVRTRVRVAALSPFDAPPPALFGVATRGPNGFLRSSVLQDRCQSRGFASAARLRAFAAALAKKFDVDDPARRGVAARLLLGSNKRRRREEPGTVHHPEAASDLSGSEDVPGDEENEAGPSNASRAVAPENVAFGTKKRPTKSDETGSLDEKSRGNRAFDVEDALARLTGLGGREDAERAWEERDQLVRSWGSGEGSPDAPPRSRASATLYREFFFPEGLGGFERPAPTAPALRDVARAAVAAFDAKCEEAVRARASGFGTGNGGGGSSGVARSAIPFGAAAGAVATDRAVLAGGELFGRGVESRDDAAVLEGEGAVLLAWVAEERGETRSNGGARKGAGQGPGPVRLRAVDDTGEMALEIAPDGEADDPGDRSASAAFDATKFTPGAMIAATRWRVVVEGSRESRRAGPGAAAIPPALLAPRCVLRVRARDVASSRADPSGPPSGAAARVRPREEPPDDTSSLPGSRPREESLDDRAPLLDVSDLLVWTPRGGRGGWHRGASPAPLGGARDARSGGGPIDGGESPAGPPPPGPISSSRARWPPPPAVAPAFVARVVRDEYVADRNGGGGWQFVFRLVGGAGSTVDAYAHELKAAGGIPEGAGAGATVVVRGALRCVSAACAPYVKFTRQTRVEVLESARDTFATEHLGRPRGRDETRSGRVNHPDHPGRFERDFERPSRDEHRLREGRARSSFLGPPPRVTLAEVARGARIGARVGAVDRRAWEVRARVAHVTLLTVRWACRTCGCDAGSMGARAANAAREAAAAAREAARTEGPFHSSPLDPSLDPSAPSASAGCARCRPPPGAFATPAAAEAAAHAACGFEAEAGVMLCDGSAQAECWIAGAAGEALLTPDVKSAATALARRHGRVTARLASVDLDPDGPPGSGGGFATHALRGYAAQSVSEREGWPLLAAVGRAARLDEMLFGVALNYKRFDAAPGERDFFDAGAAAFGAQSAPERSTRTVTIGGRATKTLVEPIPRLRAFDVRPVEAAREAAREALAADARGGR